MILDLYSEIVQAHGAADRRWRIEHAQHMAEKDFARFAQLHVIASVQPYHAIDDGRWAEAAHRTRPRQPHLRISNIPATWGAPGAGHRLERCAPQSDVDGLCGGDARDAGRQKPQRLVSGAEAQRRGSDRGLHHGFGIRGVSGPLRVRLPVGKLADMVLLSDDILSIEPTRIREATVLKTILGGKVIWDSATNDSGEPTNR